MSRDARIMTGVVQHEYGSDPGAVLRIGEVPVPAVGAQDVLVRVRAASVDRGTWHAMAGLPYPIRLAGFGVRRPKATNPGRSLAGIVESVGGAVTDLEPGEEVYGTGESVFAEFARARVGRLARKPDPLTFEEAAAVPVSGLTALQAVRDRARIQPGQSLLILGASGGVGTFAVQIAKAFGAQVTGVASTANLDLVRDLGADLVLDYTRTDVVEGRVRYDAILDIGGNRRLSQLRRALARRGRLIIVGGEAPGRWLGGTDRQVRALLLSPFVSQSLGTFVASENAVDLSTLRELIESGKVRPVVDRIYPLADTPAAIERLLQGRVRGKIVIATGA